MASKISALSALTTLDAADQLVVVDTSATETKRITIANARNDFRTTSQSFHVDKNGTNQTGIANGIHTKLTWVTERWDVGSGFDLVNSKYMPSEAGKYLIYGMAWHNVLSDGKYSHVQIYKNGAVVSYGSIVAIGSATSSITNVVSAVELNGTSDYIELYVRHNEEPTADVRGEPTGTYFGGHKL